MLKIKVDGLFVKLKRLNSVFAHRQAESGAPAVNNKSNRGAWHILQLLFWAVGGNFNYSKYEM